MRGFGIDLGASLPRVGSTVDVLGKLRPDTYRGDGSVEIMIEALSHPAAAR
jgi:hypothetical protein